VFIWPNLNLVDLVEGHPVRSNTEGDAAMTIKTIGITLKTPFVDLAGTWEPNDAERQAAWELYVEMITRVAVVPLPTDAGLDREAVASLYELFGVHRTVLRKYGPSLAEPKRNGEYNLGYLAVAALNFVIRPFLAQWHPRLGGWEAQRPESTSVLDHERAWSDHAELRRELAAVRSQLRIYAQWLSAACDVPDLLAAVPHE
jgi:hypothetical protein